LTVVLGILPQLLYASGKDPKAHCKRDNMALRSSVDVVKKKEKLKQSRYRPGVAQRVPGS
jgi:hypothetical protein